jgi:peptide/nickel transport system permease protein
MAIPMFFILLLLIFFVLRILPGDPVMSMLGGKAPMSVIEQKRHELGYDKPIMEQFFIYVGGLFRGDLGRSALTKRPIADEIGRKLPATIELTIFGFIIALAIGIFWGAEATRHHNEPVDVAGRFYAIFIYSVPVFWLGMLFQWLFGVQLNWLPIAGRISPLLRPEEITGLFLLDALITWDIPAFKDALAHIILPGLALGMIISSIFLRMVRSNMVLMLSKDFVKAARARGIKERSIIYRHSLKNAFVPIMTVMGLQLALLMAGAVLTETTFSWPGIGSYLVEKIRYRDFPAVQGTIVIFALLVVVINILVDIINALVDPRVRY